MSLSYGYNRAEENADPYDVNAAEYDGRNQPYISGRRNINVYSAIPHVNNPENGGTTLNASYGDGVELRREEGQGNGGMALEFTNQTIKEILNSEDHRSLNPTYVAGQGPITITVVDPVKVPQGDFTFKLMDPIFNVNAVISYGRWELIDNATGNIKASADQDIELGSEQYISQLGLNVKVKQTQNPGADPTNIDDNGLISGTIEFENPNDRWLSGVADRDDESGFFNIWGFNWIRSGSYTNETIGQMSDYNMTDDPNGVFEGVVMQSNVASSPFGSFEWTGGTWAPYRFASNFNDGPGISNSITNLAKLTNLNSVDIVFTDEKSEWSRVCVVEAQDDETLSIGNQKKMGLRQSVSVGKDGLPDGMLDENGDSIKGMGWFPGYALDIETGERLNIIFSEDSWQTSENGNDMEWNPTSTLLTPGNFPQYDPQNNEFSGGNYLLGGKHYIYVVKGESWVKGTEDYMTDTVSSDFSPNYDEGAWIYSKLLNDNNGTGKWAVFKNVTWVGAPLLAPGRDMNLDNKATVKLRVTKPYKAYETVTEDKFFDRNMDLTLGTTYVVAYENSASTWGGKTVTYDGVDYEVGESFVATATLNFSGSAKARAIEATALNSFNPTYSFNTNNIVAVTGDNDVAKDALDIINIVPNPYYGYSSYEVNQLDNRVKITNLPKRATIKIFTVSGTEVRTLNKDNGMTSIDWDLKNNFGIPISSGLYILHINAPGVGEKIIKWYGALRPIDLDTF
jgi:hypothetical protein